MIPKHKQYNGNKISQQQQKQVILLLSAEFCRWPAADLEPYDLILEKLQINDEDDIVADDNGDGDGCALAAAKNGQGVGGDDVVPDGNEVDGDARKSFPRVKLEKTAGRSDPSGPTAANMLFVQHAGSNPKLRGNFY